MLEENRISGSASIPELGESPSKDPRRGIAMDPRPTMPTTTPIAPNRLKAVLLLGGTLRQSDLSIGAERPLIELPVADGLDVMGVWCKHVSATAERFGLPSLPIRVIIDRTSLVPRRPRTTSRTSVTIETDFAEIRGTAGIIRDLSRDYAPDDYLLVASGNQLLIDELAPVVGDLLATEADIALLAHDDGMPVGLYLIRAGAVRSLKERGYLDLKEQALPLLSKSHRVRVVRRPHGVGLPIRTLENYIYALEEWCHARDGKPRADYANLEQWERAFGLIESEAIVEKSAKLHDAVVLRGGRVEAGALVIRSVVCPGGKVGPGETVLGTVVHGLSGGSRSGGRA